MNCVELTARIVEISVLRYTPSGFPVVDFQLEHESSIEESGTVRKIHLLLKSIAIGNMAEKLIHLQMNTIWKFSGFLTSTKNSKSIVFHIQSIQSVS